VADRKALIAGLVVAALLSLAGYRHLGWKEFAPGETRHLVDLAHPDALIRTTSLSKLPRDLLRVPIAQDVLTEDLAFYYEQHGDRLGFRGSVKRIAYEHDLDWSDRILAHVLDEPAEIALWRDGKGALRHFAIAMRRGTLTKILQEAATVALKDTQLSLAGEIKVGGAGVPVYALAINPRRTLLITAYGDRLAVLSDPGLLFSEENKVAPAAERAVAAWLADADAMARSFDLDTVRSKSPLQRGKPEHTLAISARALTLGYAPFVPGLKGLRFDFGGDAGWGTHVWLDENELPRAGLDDPELWRAAPANPSACVLLPVDWQQAAKVVTEAGTKPVLADAQALAHLEGAALACWYSASSLYTPVFVARLAHDLPDRDAALKALAAWAIKSPNADADPRKKPLPVPKLMATGAYVVFSPDPALVDLTLDTLARRHPSTADQIAGSGATLVVLTPRGLAEMAEKEIFAALAESEAALQASAKALLPPRMKALAKYPAYRLALPAEGRSQRGWQPVEWRSPQDAK
jgi:uncharacterized protein YfaA (DUF2138 family)